ncbi:MAG TPA: hypothetical protein VGD88_12835 [Opitutaceae bacterium]
MTSSFPARLVLIGLMLTVSVSAQIGPGWEAYTPQRKIHLQNKDEKLVTIDHDYSANVTRSLGSPATATYTYDHATRTETFTLLKPGERAEIRVHDNYATGSRQFEGYVTVFAPIERQMIFQIWGSGEPNRATQMILRGFNQKGGSLLATNRVTDSPKVATGIYGREIKVNVIHLQEDVGGRILVFLDDQPVLDVPDTYKDIINATGNYHKYGCYGSFESTFTEARAQWRDVRHFRGGRAP